MIDRLRVHMFLSRYEYDKQPKRREVLKINKKFKK